MTIAGHRVLPLRPELTFSPVNAYAKSEINENEKLSKIKGNKDNSKRELHEEHDENNMLIVNEGTNICVKGGDMEMIEMKGEDTKYAEEGGNISTVGCEKKNLSVEVAKNNLNIEESRNKLAVEVCENIFLRIEECENKFWKISLEANNTVKSLHSSLQQASKFFICQIMQSYTIHYRNKW